jgi:hypothetical protein
MRNEQRSRTAQRHFALWLRRFFAFPALLVHYPATARRVCALLGKTKNRQQPGTVGYFNRLLRGKKAQLRKAGRQPNSQGSFACSLAVVVVSGVADLGSGRERNTTLPRSTTRGYTISVSISPAYFLLASSKPVPREPDYRKHNSISRCNSHWSEERDRRIRVATALQPRSLTAAHPTRESCDPNGDRNLCRFNSLR